MSDPLVTKSTGEFTTPGPETVVQSHAVDEHGHLLADVEFPMPGVETVYFNDDVRAAAETKTVDAATVDTKVVKSESKK